MKKGALVILVFSALLSTPSHSQVYKVVPLPLEYATGINDSGVITGITGDNSFIWREGTVNGIGALYPGGFVAAQAINNLNQITGYAPPSADKSPVAFLWENGSMTNLGVPAQISSRGLSINDSGDVAGVGYDSSRTYPFLRKDGVVIDVTPPGTFGGSAAGINNSGQMAVNGWYNDTVSHAFLWEHGAATDLGTLESGNISSASAINNVGQVVGFSTLSPSGGAAAFLSSGGTMTNLGYIYNAPWAFAFAYDINDAGEVVGYSSYEEVNSANRHAFIWKNGGMIDLNEVADTSGGWNLTQAMGINNKGDIICWGFQNGVTRSALLRPTNIVILSPESTDFWLGGESQKIAWLAPKGKPLNIYYTEDFRPESPTWVSIVSGYPSDSEQYLWNIPDTLNSRYAAIRIVDASDPSSFAFSDPFHLRTLEMVRLNADETFTRFRQGIDSWSFSNVQNVLWPKSWYLQFNYQSGIDPFLHEQYPHESPFDKANDSDFVDWPLFVRTFGFNNCYQPVWFGLDTSYNQFATAKWKAIKTHWDGSCSGMALTSILAFDNRTSLVAKYPSFPASGPLSGTGINDSLRLIINELFEHFDGKQHIDYAAWAVRRDARTLINDLRDAFLSETNMHQYLYLAWKEDDGSEAAHAIVPYKLERDPAGPGRYKVRVYDVSHPELNPEYVLIDSTGDSAVAPVWSARRLTKVCLMDNAITYLSPPAIGTQASRGVAVPASSAYPDIEIYPAGDPDVLIESVNGKIEYKNGSLTETLPMGAGLLPPTASPAPPAVYGVPWDNYRVRLGASGNHLGLSRFSNYEEYSYERDDADSSQTDNISLDDGMTLANHDAALKHVAMESIGNFGGGSIRYNFSKLAVAAEESLRIKENGETTTLINFGSPKTCDLFVKKAYAYGRLATFRHAGLLLPGNASFLFSQGNDSIGTARMLIDNGRDGSYDDTVFVSSDILGVQDPGVPLAFVLHQNYPNPFNPRTTIRYELPASSNVTLKIYDLFGRTIATLVNGKQTAGLHSVEWNAGNFASGVYVYELRAGDFVASKKLLFVK
ncbi:MAG TPA: T9SS type A sorting domain-containing protein [Bacteroidota bacterium]|nr:T9SS type A sorting domain-containing protein [Bacteroidota bacterium]